MGRIQIVKKQKDGNTLTKLEDKALKYFKNKHPDDYAVYSLSGPLSSKEDEKYKQKYKLPDIKITAFMKEIDDKPCKRIARDDFSGYIKR